MLLEFSSRKYLPESSPDKIVKGKIRGSKTADNNRSRCTAGVAAF